MNNVTPEGQFDWSSVLRVPADATLVSRYQLQQGDVLFNNTNSVDLVGKSALFVSYPEPVVFSNHFTRLRTKPALLPDFLAFWLQHQWRSGVFADICNRWIGQAAVQKGKLLELSIPLPPLAEQRDIASLLAGQLEALQRTRSAVRVQMDAVELMVSAHLKSVFDSLGAQNWPRRPLGEFGQTSSGSTPSRTRPDYYGGDIPWVKTAELTDGLIHSTRESITRAALRECSLRLLPRGTVLIAMYGQGQTRGRTGLLTTEAATNQACFAVMPNHDVFLPEYLQLWFRHNYQALREQSEGRGGSQPNLNGQLLRAQRVQLPPLEIQERVVSEARQVEAAGDALTRALAEQSAIVIRLEYSLAATAFGGGRGAT